MSLEITNVPEDILNNFNSVFKERYGVILSRIYEQYNTICSEDKSDVFIREIERFHFEELISNSPYKNGALSAGTLLYFQKLISDFAERWDRLVNTETGRDGNHKYFLTYITDYRDTKVIAKEFNRYGKTDRKLIAITIPENTRRIEYIPFLHEMGHFIGGRNRERRKEILVDLTLLCFLRQVYERCVSFYNGVSPDIPIKSGGSSFTTLDLQEDAFCTKIIFDLKPIYEALRDMILKNAKRTKWQKQDDGFSKDFVAWIIGCIEKNLSIRGQWDETIDKIKADGFEKKDSIIELLHSAGKEILEEFNAEEISSITAMIDCFEEPIADCFMIRVGDISYRQYLRIILSQTWDRWNRIRNEEGDAEEYLSNVAGEVSRIRILSITYAMKVRSSEIYSAIDKVNIFTRRSRYNRKARRMLCGMHKEQIKAFGMIEELNDLERERKKLKPDDERYKILDSKIFSIKHELFKQNLLNPQMIISQYISKEVFNHSRYNELKKPLLKELVEQLRIYKSKWSPIIDARIWFYRKTRITDG